tara:strand:+ start:724 stop:849 length:126 start_codon:yes stop_codon:yes gene_type:complete
MIKLVILFLILSGCTKDFNPWTSVLKYSYQHATKETKEQND